MKNLPEEKKGGLCYSLAEGKENCFLQTSESFEEGNTCLIARKGDGTLQESASRKGFSLVSWSCVGLKENGPYSTVYNGGKRAMGRGVRIVTVDPEPKLPVRVSGLRIVKRGRVCGGKAHITSDLVRAIREDEKTLCAQSCPRGRSYYHFWGFLVGGVWFFLGQVFVYVPIRRGR